MLLVFLRASDCFAATQQTVMHCVLWHLSIRTSRNVFNSLSDSGSSVGLDHTGESYMYQNESCSWVAWTSFNLLTTAENNHDIRAKS